MRANQCFIDTNILIYAYDKNAGDKHRLATDLIQRYWEQDAWPFISVQVLQECFVNLTRLGLPDKEASSIIHDLCAWQVIDNDQALLIQGLLIKQDFQVSFWDALIIAAAQRAKVKYLISEDLAHHFHYGTVTVINPFI